MSFSVQIFHCPILESSRIHSRRNPLLSRYCEGDTSTPLNSSVPPPKARQLVEGQAFLTKEIYRQEIDLENLSH